MITPLFEVVSSCVGIWLTCVSSRLFAPIGEMIAWGSAAINRVYALAIAFFVMDLYDIRDAGGSVVRITNPVAFLDSVANRDMITSRRDHDDIAFDRIVKNRLGRSGISVDNETLKQTFRMSETAVNFIGSDMAHILYCMIKDGNSKVHSNCPKSLVLGRSSARELQKFHQRAGIRVKVHST